MREIDFQENILETNKQKKNLMCFQILKLWDIVDRKTFQIPQPPYPWSMTPEGDTEAHIQL